MSDPTEAPDTDSEEQFDEFEAIQGPGAIYAYSSAAQDEVQDRTIKLIRSPYDPSAVVMIGDKPAQEDFVAALQRRARHEVRPLAYADQEEHELGSIFSSETKTRALISYINESRKGGTREGGENILPARTVVVLYQENYPLTYLPMFVHACPDVTIYFYCVCDPTGEGRDLVKTYIGPDGEALPEGVDLSAEPAEDEGGIPTIPIEAMYGRSHELAEGLETSLGLAYPAIMAAACGYGIQASGAVRPTLYVNLLGDVGEGKSVTRERVMDLFFPELPTMTDDSPRERDARCIYKVPASDQGLYRILADAKGQPRLLDQDEMRNLLLKAGIENSSLVSVLCQLYNSNAAGGADKKSDYSINVKLSILGCLKIANPAEFPSVFGFATAHGLYDRCIFGVEPDGDFRWRPWTPPSFNFKPSTPSVSPDVYEEVNAWGDKKDRRLRELITRVAYITAAINGDEYVSSKALTAAIRFIEWQKKLRIFYQPAKGANEHSECVEAIEDAFRRSPGKCGNWREMSRNGNWHRRFPRVLTGVKKMMVAEGVLVYDKGSKKHFLNEKEKSNG